jgi:hypothetical protein
VVTRREAHRRRGFGVRRRRFRAASLATGQFEPPKTFQERAERGLDEQRLVDPVMSQAFPSRIGSSVPATAYNVQVKPLRTENERTPK